MKDIFEIIKNRGFKYVVANPNGDVKFFFTNKINNIEQDVSDLLIKHAKLTVSNLYRLRLSKD